MEEYNTGPQPRQDHRPQEALEESGHQEVRVPDRAILVPRGKAEAMKTQKREHAIAQDQRRPENLPWWMKQRMANRGTLPAFGKGQSKGKGKDKGKSKGKGLGKDKGKGKA